MIAKDLREIVANDIDDVEVQDRLSALADEADRLAGQPDPAAVALDAEQGARAIGLREATRLLAPAFSEMRLSSVEVNAQPIAELWIKLAEHGAAWVRDGVKPGDPDPADGGDDQDRRRP